jgi:SM-20-related protein
MPAVEICTAASFDEAADRLAGDGWCILPGFLEHDLVGRLAAEAEEGWQAGCFRHAGIGRGEDWELRPEIRSDKVLWLESASCTPAQALYLARLEALRHALNGRLFLGLFDFEGHLAVYPPGTRYRKHLDQFRDLGARVLTCVFYLNTEWEDGDGGELRLFLDDGGRVDVLPRGGRLVMFFSDRFYHEVLPGRRNRYSITGWFRRRAG